MVSPGDPLYLDVTDDLRRVDDGMTRLLMDRDLRQDFIGDPNGVLIRLGLHPSTSDEINNRVNRIFWATITDSTLLGILEAHYADFVPARQEELQRYFLDGLREGVVRHDIDYDLQAIRHLFDNEGVLTQVVLRNMEVINRNGLLEREYTRDEMRAYVGELVSAVRAGRPIREHPKLEVWDENYGVGQPFGAVMFEVGPVATAFAAVEVGAYVTAVLEVGFWGVVAEGVQRTAIVGDPGALRALTLVGRALDFSGELLSQAYNFQRRNFQ